MATNKIQTGIRFEPEVLYKISYIAKQNVRSLNAQLEFLAKECIKEFENQNGEISVEDINEELISDSIYSKGIPDPELIIRPSGEIRTSNFLLWQSAYSEYYFTDVLWPDFKPRELDRAIIAYQNRSRRFGGV